MVRENSSDSIFVLKTPEQLKQQTNLVNLKQSLDFFRKSDDYQNEFFPVPTGSNQDIESYKKYSKLSPEEKKILYLSADSDPYQKYELYIQALRSLRQDQQYKRKLDDKVQGFKGVVIPNSINSQKDFLEKIKFSPDLAHGVIRLINGSLERSNIDSIDYEKARSSEKDFLDGINYALIKKPEVLYDAFDQLKYVLSPEKVKEIASKIGTNRRFLIHYSDLKSIFTAEEQRQLITPILNDKKYASELMDLFKDPDAARLYPKDQIKKIIEKRLKEDGRDLSKKDIESYINSGLINSINVKNLLFDRINNFKEVKEINDFVPFLPPEVTLQDIKQEVMNAYMTNGELTNLHLLVSLGNIFDLTEKVQLVKTLLFREHDGPVGYWMIFLEKLLPTVELKPLLQEYIAISGIDFSDFSVKQILEAEVLSLEDKEDFINQQIKNGKANSFLQYFNNNINQFPEDKRNDLVKVILDNINPKESAQFLRVWEKFVSDESLKIIIDKISNDYSAVENIFDSVQVWGNRLGHEYTKAFLERFQSTYSVEIFSNIDSASKFIYYGEHEDFVFQLIKGNPPAAICFIQSSPNVKDALTNMRLTVTPQIIVDIALQDQTTLEFAPKSFREFYKQFSINKSIDEQKALLLEAVLLYRNISLIKLYGLSEGLKRLQASSNIPISTERELISTFYCFAILKTSNPDQFDQIKSLGTTIEESKQILFNQFSKLFGIDREFTAEEVNRFFGTMESPMPFMVYFLQHKDSTIHKELLAQIFNSIILGKFSEWKYGLNLPESLEQLKQSHLLPEKLTFEQYNKWRTDGQTTLFESLATDTETTANAIKSYLESNLNHLEIQDILNHLMITYPQQDLMKGLKQDLSSIGQYLSDTNKELTIQQKEEFIDHKIIDELKKKKITLEHQRNDLVRARKIFRLMDIKPNEVISGYFLEGENSKQRGDLIEKALTELRKSSAEENNFIYDEIKNMLDSLKSSSDEKRNLTCVDSSDPKIWIEIGEKPVSSCQSYDQGSLNECLVAYTDPNTKILVLRNEKGEVVARSIFRLLETSDGEPALHIERVYSASTSKGIFRCMFSRSYQKAQEMGLPLFESEIYQNENGEEQEAQLAEGYQIRKVDGALYSKGSRAPRVYVDSAGGVNYEGRFKIENLAEIVNRI